MSKSINENDTTQNISINTKQNLKIINLSLNINKDNKNKIKENNNSSKRITYNNTNEHNSLNNSTIKKCENISINKEEKKIINSLKEKEKIFKVNYRTIHDGDSPDNIKQIIIKHFVNFFKYFINYIISKKINKEKIIFQIGYQTKNKIKLRHIIELTVEQLLSFEPNKNIKNENNQSFDYEEKLKNEENIKKIRNIVGSSLDKLFRTKVIELFKNIYIKDINDENEKNIDLKIYGIEGMGFALNEEIPTYKKLKDKFKDNKTKLKIMDDIINTKIINPPKTKIFKVYKK